MSTFPCACGNKPPTHGLAQVNAETHYVVDDPSSSIISWRLVRGGLLLLVLWLLIVQDKDVNSLLTIAYYCCDLVKQVSMSRVGLVTVMSTLVISNSLNIQNVIKTESQQLLNTIARKCFLPSMAMVILIWGYLSRDWIPSLIRAAFIRHIKTIDPHRIHLAILYTIIITMCYARYIPKKVKSTPETGNTTPLNPDILTLRKEVMDIRSMIVAEVDRICKRIDDKQLSEKEDLIRIDAIHHDKRPRLSKSTKSNFSQVRSPSITPKTIIQPITTPIAQSSKDIPIPMMVDIDETESLTIEDATPTASNPSINIQPRNTMNSRPERTGNVKCIHCGKIELPNHRCWVVDKQIKCFRCGERNHIAIVCQNELKLDERMPKRSLEQMIKKLQDQLDRETRNRDLREQRIQQRSKQIGTDNLHPDDRRDMYKMFYDDDRNYTPSLAGINQLSLPNSVRATTPSSPFPIGTPITNSPVIVGVPYQPFGPQPHTLSMGRH